MTMHFLRVRSGRVRAADKTVLPPEIEVAGRLLPLEVKANARARRLTMRLSPGGCALRVTTPPRSSASAVLNFIQRHQGWIETRLAAMPARLVVADGALIPLRGGAFRLRHDVARRASRFMPADGGMEAHLEVGGAGEHVGLRVTEFLKREARRDLQAAVDRHAAAIGLRPKGLALKDTRSRWGSCTQEGRLSFSWRIVMAPPFVLDYLAAHEVAHLREMNHGTAFWALTRDLCPCTDEAKTWLKKNGASLQAIDFG